MNAQQLLVISMRMERRRRRDLIKNGNMWKETLLLPAAVFVEIVFLSSPCFAQTPGAHHLHLRCKQSLSSKFVGNELSLLI